MLLTYLVAGILFEVCAVGAITYCPNGWQGYDADSTCLKAYGVAETFHNARAVCQAEGGDLVILNSAEKGLDVDALVTAIAGNAHFWIGLWDENHDQMWTAIDGSPLTYTNWHAGEPNNAGGQEQCGLVYGLQNTWNDLNCETALLYVCEIVGAAPHCPLDWTYFDGDNTCSRAYFDQSKNFHDSRDFCWAEGGTLVTVDSADKSDFVTALRGTNDLNYWIGLWDEGHNQLWTNIYGIAYTYTNWNTGEPNNAGGSEFCGEVIGSGSAKGLWNDVSCARTYDFVCEMNPLYYICEDGWAKSDQADDVCIKVFIGRKRFHKARKVCKDEGGDLATHFNNEDQNNFVAGLLKPKATYWIGIHAPLPDQVYSFVDGTPLGGYDAFRPGEPNNSKKKKHCVEMRNGKWSDKLCKRIKKFVCQKQAYEVPGVTPQK